MTCGLLLKTGECTATADVLQACCGALLAAVPCLALDYTALCAVDFNIIAVCAR